MPRMIDPPSGWMYGFPMIDDFVPSSSDLTGTAWEHERVQWFLSKGYPQHQIDRGMLQYCRVWETEE